MNGIAVAINELAPDSLKVEDAPKKEEKAVVVEEVLPTPDYNKAALTATSAKGGAMEIFVYEKIGLGNGNYSNNPWLMELPDPISKAAWDNYITMSPADVKSMGLNEMLRQDIDGSVVDVTVNGVKVTAPVFPQPGQTPGTIGLALGYGRTAESLKVCKDIGVNAYQLFSVNENNIQPFGVANVSKAEGKHMFAATQIQHTIMGREEFLLRETSIRRISRRKIKSTIILLRCFQFMEVAKNT